MKALTNLLWFWHELLEAGLYNALDYLSFLYLNDKYVPHNRLTGCFMPDGCGKFGHDSEFVVRDRVTGMPAPSGQCRFCNGAGWIIDNAAVDGIWAVTCPTCDGTGRKA